MSTHFIRFPLLRLLSSWFLPGAWSDTQVNIPAKIMAVIITTLPFGLTPALVHALENSPAHCSSASSANASNPKSYADTTSTANKIPLRSTTITDKSVHLGADSLLSNQSNLFIVDGNVSIQTRLYSIEADSAKYNHRQHHLTAQGNITYRDENKFIESDNLDINLESGIGEANNTRYRLLEQNTNGVAGQISFKDSQLTLSRSTYSTCEENEDERKAWQIRANSIELHPEQNEGIARNMKLEILNVPVLYLPYISFPLEGRKSGFLAPRPSYSSNEGFDVAIPYYFNLKPNYDLTFTPRIINSRGAQAAAEFRYLHKNSSGHLASGDLGIEVLPDDKKTNTNRTHFTLKHHNQFSDSTNIDIEYAHVTDKQYFSDLGSELNTVNKSQLSRSFQSETQGRNWLFHSIIQDYQILDNNPEPYRRIPQLGLDSMGNISHFQWRNQLQYTYFQKSNADYIHRAAISPVISLPLKRQFGYFTPSLGLHGRIYQISKPEQKQEYFANWHFNSKTGLFFERSTDNAYQTLIPEIQYTYIPDKDQSQLPLIDSIFTHYDIEHLFNSNRYAGYDRLGDENRLSWSLSSDYTRSNATRPLFYIRLAQAIYLSDHNTMINNEKTIEKNDLVNAALIKSQLSSTVSTGAQAYYFSGETRLNNGNVSINYKNDYEQVELAYRYHDQLVEQASIIGILDISRQWRIAGRWLYSLNNERTREALLALEYNNCCWAVRLMGRQYASQANTELNSSVGVQIELKGLTKIGSSLDKQFSDEVFGNQ